MAKQTRKAPAAGAITSIAQPALVPTASTVLSVTVNGGIAPFSIQVILVKNGVQQLQFAASGSFTHLFDNLEAGQDYDVTVAGFNPAGGNTVCQLDTAHIILKPDSDANPSTKTGASYLVDFHFTV